MSTNDQSPDSGIESEPQEWPAPDPVTLSPEAVENEPDDVLAALPDDAPLPPEADEADVLDQRTETGVDVEDEVPEAPDET